MKSIIEKLKGGDRRSIGKANKVVAEVLKCPSLFGDLFNGMYSNDPIIRMRTADALAKISEKHPEYLQPYKKFLIEDIAKINQQEVRWHVAQMLPLLKLTKKERSKAVNIFYGYLNDKSKIVKTFSMQALADLSEKDPQLKIQITKLIRQLAKEGSPAMQSRGKKLLQQLDG